MKNLINTICFIATTVAGAYMAVQSAYASEMLRTRLGGVTLNIPYPDNLCLIGNSRLERNAFEHQKMLQKKLENKLLAVWIDCGTQEKARRGVYSPLLFYAMVVVPTHGNPPQVFSLPGIGRKQFNKNLLARHGIQKPSDLEMVKKHVNKKVSEVNLFFGRDRELPSVTKIIGLGLLDVTDSIHRGFINIVKSKTRRIPVSIVESIVLIKEMGIKFIFCHEYNGTRSIKDLLLRAKNYSGKIIASN